MERNHVFLRALFRNGHRVLSPFVGVVLWFAPQLPLLAQTTVDQLAAEGSENVVQIRAKFASKSQDGFGLVIGVRNGLIYVATANKLVRGSRGEADPAPAVTFAHTQAAPVRGKLLNILSPSGGLAVIEIEMSKVPGLSWTRDIVSARSSGIPGDSVWLVRSDRRPPATPIAGKIIEVADVNRTDYSGFLIVAEVPAPIGTLGAALISADGVVGMIVSDSSPQKVEAVPIETIEEVVKGWGLPWLLSVVQPKQDCDRMASSPDDLRRPADVVGVSLEKLDVKAAINVCFGPGSKYWEKVPRFAFQTGRIFEAEGNLREAEKLYASAASKGYAAAQSALGVLYEKQGKDKEAAELYRRAAEQRDPVGQTSLATMLRDEYGGQRKNDEEAVRLYKEAAKQNYPAALSGLGWMYEQGRAGGAPNEPEARRLYERAAEGGDRYAQRALARMSLK